MGNRVIPARYPLGPVWPAEMRADMAAAYCDYDSAAAFYKAVAAGDAPKPSALRGTGERRVRVWHRQQLDLYLAKRHALASISAGQEPDEDIVGLI